MTNEDDDESSTCYPRKAALLAVHLVSQVLDEAYVIASSAKESGEPRRYLSNVKNLRNHYACDELHDAELTFTVSKENNDHIYENEKIIATSTPQKMHNNTKYRNDTSFIGQGDEEFEVKNHERKSTSMFISHIFDMSDVEQMSVYDGPGLEDITVSEENLPKTIKNIIECYVKSAADIAFAKHIQGPDENAELSLQISNNSSYSLLEDASINYIKLSEYPQNQEQVENIVSDSENIKVEEYSTLHNECGRKDNITATKYEDAYLTLNRDYDQYSEEEEPILHDPKIISMQEVELSGPSKTFVNELQDTALGAVSGVSTLGSRKSSLVQRCRMQGSRLLTCLRGCWWRRKVFGKTKKAHADFTRELCPLSPSARYRASSLLDQRNLRSPSPSKSVAWKFNTVNETLVHSSRWKDFGYKMNFNKTYKF